MAFVTITDTDGVVRRGTGYGMGIALATHWMPLPPPPKTGEGA